jgi:hypothetical protein
VNARDWNPSILECGDDDSTIQNRIVDALTRHQVRGNINPFTIAVDATETVQSLEASSDYGAIIGGVFPKHFIPISGLLKETVKEILDRKSIGEIPRASEVKVALIMFQNAP